MQSTSVCNPDLRVVKTAALSPLRVLFSIGRDQAAMLALHLHERWHHSAHTQLIDIAAEDTSQQRCANCIRNFVTKVTANEAGNRLVGFRNRGLQFFRTLRLPQIRQSCLPAEERRTQQRLHFVGTIMRMPSGIATSSLPRTM